MPPVPVLAVLNAIVTPRMVGARLPAIPAPVPEDVLYAMVESVIVAVTPPTFRRQRDAAAAGRSERGVGVDQAARDLHHGRVAQALRADSAAAEARLAVRHPHAVERDAARR